MKTNEILAQDHEPDHEVRMARGQVYSAAKNAIELHKLLQNLDESQGLDGWVASYITLSSEYLEKVKNYLEYDQVSATPALSETTTSSSAVASFVKPGAGTLFGGSYQQRDNPFRKPARKVKKK
jgi:hypothetical protein